MGKGGRFFDILSIMMLGLTILTIGCYTALAINPYLPINPFPPPTPITLLVLPGPEEVAGEVVTPTPSGPVMPPTWTPTPTFTPRPTLAPSFTPTVTPTPGPTRVFPTRTSTPTPTPLVTRSPYAFTAAVSYETPYYGCNWAGVGGIVQDLDGKPLADYPIHVWGGGIDVVILSGSNTRYGVAGWEQFFNDHPIDAQGIYQVQLHDKNSSNPQPISPKITLNFEALCSKSLASVVFIKNH